MKYSDKRLKPYKKVVFKARSLERQESLGKEHTLKDGLDFVHEFISVSLSKWMRSPMGDIAVCEGGMEEGIC